MQFRPLGFEAFDVVDKQLHAGFVVYDDLVDAETVDDGVIHNNGIDRVRAHLFSCPRKSEHTVTRKINSAITVQSDLSGDLKIMEEVVVDERNFFINKYRIINEG
ncbi:hypothetical protein GQX74_009484 [Glossina fuscipes]|nr:hypothetical protein GQX74_009484 [Glossina fuscipes]